MTDLWKFSETLFVGGGSLEEEYSKEESANGDEYSKEDLKGGMSVSNFLCREKTGEGDSQLFNFFTDLTVPLGLIHLPECNDSNEYTGDRDIDEPKESCESFDKLFSLISTTLGKKEKNRRTRKNKTIM